MIDLSYLFDIKIDSSDDQLFILFFKFSNSWLSSNNVFIKLFILNYSKISFYYTESLSCMLTFFTKLLIILVLIHFNYRIKRYKFYRIRACFLWSLWSLARSASLWNRCSVSVIIRFFTSICLMCFSRRSWSFWINPDSSEAKLW